MAGVKKTEVFPMTGHHHPVSRVTDQIVAYFEPFGFEVVDGPEMETEHNNFDLLNIPAYHPARESHDTFYLDNGLLLRTHTSPVQIRATASRKPPVRLLAPGRVYRNESTDSTHNATFYQVEGLVIDQTTNLAQLMGMLQGMLESVFGQELKLRFRLSYFPFVEPGFEVDIRGQSKWLEVLGAGMIHPQVIRNMGFDPQIYQGFAFGVGVERLINLSSGVSDVRLNLTGDYRYGGQY